MIPRTIYPYILESIRNKPVTLIIGARQTGKTFLCREIHETMGINYVSRTKTLFIGTKLHRFHE